MGDDPNKPVDLEGMYYAKTALVEASLPSKAHFVPGKAVHVQFDSGS